MKSSKKSKADSTSMSRTTLTMEKKLLSDLKIQAVLNNTTLSGIITRMVKDQIKALLKKNREISDKCEDDTTITLNKKKYGDFQMFAELDGISFAQYILQALSYYSKYRHEYPEHGIINS